MGWAPLIPELGLTRPQAASVRGGKGSRARVGVTRAGAGLALFPPSALNLEQGRAGLKCGIRPGQLVPFLVQSWPRQWGSAPPPPRWD